MTPHAGMGVGIASRLVEAGPHERANGGHAEPVEVEPTSIQLQIGHKLSTAHQ